MLMLQSRTSSRLQAMSSAYVNPMSPYADFFREKEGIPLLEVKAHLEIPSAKDYQGMF